MTALPVAMNRLVYTMLRGLKRELPQMPWPDVHPLPMPLPAPTSRPASTLRARLTAGSAICSGSIAASIKPVRVCVGGGGEGGGVGLGFLLG